MKISIFGLGYVGCVSLGCLAQNGHDVIGVDIQEEKVDLINKGLATIVENEIDKIISTQQQNGNQFMLKPSKKQISHSYVLVRHHQLMGN